MERNEESERDRILKLKTKNEGIAFVLPVEEKENWVKVQSGQYLFRVTVPAGMMAKVSSVAIPIESEPLTNRDHATLRQILDMPPAKAYHAWRKWHSENFPQWNERSMTESELADCKKRRAKR